jgi:hypothetical protein
MLRAVFLMFSYRPPVRRRATPDPASRPDSRTVFVPVGFPFGPVEMTELALLRGRVYAGGQRGLRHV